MATALACSLLLFRGPRRSGARLLLWCGLFFLSLAVEDSILFLDPILVPATDLFALRTSVAPGGVTLLPAGLIQDLG